MRHHETVHRLLAALLLGALVLAGCGARTAAQPNPGASTFVIQGQPVTLSGGRASAPAAPGSAAQVRTAIIAGPAAGPGYAAVVLAQATGGSGTFFYLAAALAGGRTTNAVLLGDRIAVQALTARGGEVTVTYLDHAAGQPMAAPPSVRTVRRYQLRGGQLLPIGG